MQRKRIVKKIKPPIQEGRKEGGNMIEETIHELLSCDKFAYINATSKKKIAHAVNEIMGNLEGMSEFETKKTLKLVKILLSDYLVVSSTEDILSK